MDRKLRLDLIFRAAGNAVGFLKGVGGESDKAGRAVKAARDRVTQLQASVRNVQSYRGLETRLGATRTAMDAARAEAARLGRAHSATQNPTRQMTRALEVARTKVRELKTQEEGQIRTLGELRGKLRDAGLSTQNLSGSEAKLTRQIREANGQMREQARRMTELADRQKSLQAARGRYDKTQVLAGTMQGAGASSLAAGTALGAPVVLAVREAVNFEDAMLDVRKVVDFDTPQQFAQMSRDVLLLSENLNQPPEGIAAIIAAAGQAKIARSELLGFADDAGKMGVAFDTTADDAGYKMATWRTAFAMTQPEVRALADQINYLGDNGNATALKISDVVTRIGPLGGVAGLAAAQVAALGSTIVGMGVEQEIAATGIKNTMLALTKGEAATKSQRVAFAALGLEAVSVSKAMQMDAGGTILDVMGRIAKLAPDRQASIMTQLFGSESVAAIAPMMSQLDVLKTNLDAVADASLYAGSMQKEFENRQSGAKTAIGQGQKALQGLAVEIGTTFLPQIKAASAAVRSAARGVNSFAQAHPVAVKVVATLVAVIAAALVVFGGLAMAVAAVLGPFALLQFALTQASILFAPVIAGLTGTGAAAGGAAVGMNALLWPVLLVVAAIAALAAGAYLIYRNWGSIGPWLAKLWSGISAVAQGGIRLIMGYVMNFTPLGFIIRNWQPITNFLGALWGSIKAVVGLGLDSIRYYLLAFTPLGLIARGWGDVGPWLAKLWSGISAVAQGGIRMIMGYVMNFTPLGFIIRNWQPITSFLGALWGSIKAVVSRGLDSIRTYLLDSTPLGIIARSWGPLTGLISNVWDNIKGAVTRGISAIKAAIAGFQPLNDFKAAFANVWTYMQELPARLMNAGADAMKGFTRGIQGQRANVQAAAADAAGRAETGARVRLDTHSPSRVFARIGRDVMAGFGVGIDGGAGGAASRMRQAAGAIAAAGALSLPGLNDGRPVVTFNDAPPFNAPPPFAGAPPSGPGSPGGGMTIGTVEIHIHQQPGETAEDIARKVMDILKPSQLASFNASPDTWE